MQRNRTFRACLFCRLDRKNSDCIHPASEGRQGSCTPCAQKRFPCGPYELKEDSERYLIALPARPTLPSYIGNDTVELNRSVPISNTQNRNALEMQEGGGGILSTHNTGPPTTGTSMESLPVGTSTLSMPQEPIDPGFLDFFVLSPNPTPEAASSALLSHSGPEAESNRSNDYIGQQCGHEGDLDTISPFVVYKELRLHQEHIKTLRKDLEARDGLSRSNSHAMNDASEKIEKEIVHMVASMVDLYHTAQKSGHIDQVKWMCPYVQRAMVDTNHLPLEQRKEELLEIMYFYRTCKDTIAVDKVLQNLMQLGMVDSATKPTAADLFAESMDLFPESPVTGENGIGNSVLPRLHYLVSLGIIALMPALQIFAASKETPKLDMFNRNLLHVAAEKGYTLILEHLLNLSKSHPTFRLDIEARDAALRTPVCLAIIHGHEPTYRLLKQRGAKLDVRDNTSHSLLASAASGNHIGILKDLIDAGRPVNEIVLQGAYQPLQAAAEKGHLEAVQVLINNGAGPRLLKIPEKKTASQLARDNGYTVVADVIDEAG